MHSTRLLRALACAMWLCAWACSGDPEESNGPRGDGGGDHDGGAAGGAARDGGPQSGAGRGGGGTSGAGRSGASGGGTGGTHAGDGGSAGSAADAGADAAPPPPACPGCFDWVYVPFEATDSSGVFGSTPDVADLDGDGKLDLIAPIQSRDPVNVRFWRSPSATGGDGWQAHDIGQHGASSNNVEVAAGDMDGDGDSDVVSTTDYTIVWWENLGDFEFAQHIIAWPGGEGMPLSGIAKPRLGDLDGDGDLDLAATSYADDRVLVWENRVDAGKDTPWPSHEVARVSYPYDLDIADGDGDGDLDLIVASLEADTVTLHSNADGRGQIWVPIAVLKAFDYATAGRAADMDGDGVLDVLGSGADGIAYARRIGDAEAATYETRVVYDEDVVFEATPADMDDDGDLDVVGLDSYDLIPTWWENDGSGAGWARHRIAGSFTQTTRMRVLDVDGDGDPDILLRQAVWDHLLLERRGCEGACEAQRCEEGERRCQGVAHEGERLTAVLTCVDGVFEADGCTGANQLCDDQGDDGAPACIIRVCEPNAPGCSSGLRATCNALGTAWENFLACPTSSSCVEGVCQPEPPFCMPEAELCQGDEAVRCATSGESVTAVAACDERGEICHAGRCEASTDVDITGEDDYWSFSSLAGIRGNYYVMGQGRLLQEISLEMAVTDRRTLRWIVYEGSGISGLTKVHENTTATIKPGIVRMSSGPISVQLQAGKSYLIGVHIDRPFTFVLFNASMRVFEAIDTPSFATVQAVRVDSVALPPATVSVSLTPGTGTNKPAFGQRLLLAPLP